MYHDSSLYSLPIFQYQTRIRTVKIQDETEGHTKYPLNLTPNRQCINVFLCFSLQFLALSLIINYNNQQTDPTSATFITITALLWLLLLLLLLLVFLYALQREWNTIICYHNLLSETAACRQAGWSVKHGKQAAAVNDDICSACTPVANRLRQTVSEQAPCHLNPSASSQRSQWLDGEEREPK